MKDEGKANCFHFILHPSAFILYHRRVKRERVDRLVVERGLAPTRTRAQGVVVAGGVMGGDRRVEKPSESVAPDAPLRVRGSDDPAARYGGRGALKMEEALQEFPLNTHGFLCLAARA